MNIKLIHKFKLKNVKLNLKKTDCFLHDFEFLGVTAKELEDEFEGQITRVYLGVMSDYKIKKKCIWCEHKSDTEAQALEHSMNTHYKTLKSIKVFRFQEELYRQKLLLFRAGIIDSTYFAYTNWICQHCDNRNARGRGLCSKPESARNKIRSLNLLGLTADDFFPGFRKHNVGFIIGKLMEKKR